MNMLSQLMPKLKKMFQLLWPILKVIVLILIIGLVVSSFVLILETFLIGNSFSTNDNLLFYADNGSNESTLMFLGKLVFWIVLVCLILATILTLFCDDIYDFEDFLEGSWHRLCKLSIVPMCGLIIISTAYIFSTEVKCRTINTYWAMYQQDPDKWAEAYCNLMYESAVDDDIDEVRTICCNFVKIVNRASIFESPNLAQFADKWKDQYPHKYEYLAYYLNKHIDDIGPNILCSHLMNLDEEEQIEEESEVLVIEVPPTTTNAPVW